MYHQTSPKQTAAGNSPSESYAARVRELLASYSSLTEEAQTELVSLYRQLTPVELALLASDVELGRTLARFQVEHRQHLKTPFQQYAVLVGIAAAGFAILIYVLAFRS